VRGRIQPRGASASSGYVELLREPGGSSAGFLQKHEMAACLFSRAAKGSFEGQLEERGRDIARGLRVFERRARVTGHSGAR